MSHQDTNPLVINTFTLEEAVKKIRSGLNLSDNQLSEADLLKYGAKGKLEICAWISNSSPARCEIPRIYGHPTIEIKEVSKEFIDKRFKLEKNLWMDAETFNKDNPCPSSIKIYNPRKEDDQPFRAIWDFRGLDSDENKNRYFNYQSVQYDLLIQIDAADLEDLEETGSLELKEFDLCKEHSLWVPNDSLTKSKALLKNLIIQDIPDTVTRSRYKNGQFLTGLSIRCSLPDTTKQPAKIKKPSLRITEKALNEFIPFLRKNLGVVVKPVFHAKTHEENILTVLQELEKIRRKELNIFFNKEKNQLEAEEYPANNKRILFYEDGRYFIEKTKKSSLKSDVQKIIAAGGKYGEIQLVKNEVVKKLTDKIFKKNWQELREQGKIVDIKKEPSQSRNKTIFKIPGKS